MDGGNKKRPGNGRELPGRGMRGGGSRAIRLLCAQRAMSGGVGLAVKGCRASSPMARTSPS